MSKTETFRYVDEQFADIQLLRYQLPGWENLSLRQKEYIYYLSQATLAGRDIVTDQFGRYNLVIRRVLEEIYTRYTLQDESDKKDLKALKVYLKRIWFSNGIYHHYGCEKMQPEFSVDFWERAVRQVLADAKTWWGYDSVEMLLAELTPIIFRPDVLPKRVNSVDGEDLVLTSACNYYEGVTEAEAEAYYDEKKQQSGSRSPSWGLNSKLVSTENGLVEEVWHADGKYGEAIRPIISWLEKAQTVAENDKQVSIIDLLITYYRTGDLRVFDEYSIEWLKEQEGQVDFVNGFIEVYGDPLGLKASWEGIVEYKDLQATKRTQTISEHAQWFEDHSPIDKRFKKQVVKGVTANVVNAAMLGGDEYPSTAIGINLPNADWIRAEHGSKSVTIGNLIDAYNKAAANNGFKEEFVIDEPTLALLAEFGDACDDLHTDLHECLGHGSGQLLPGVSPDALKSYSSTIEEARADLFALYYLADEKMIELGLLDNKKAYQSQYYSYLMNGLLTQLTRIEPGKNIEEAHMRNRSLIAHWVLEQGDGAVELVQQDGKLFVRVNDYMTLRGLFARLLAEIQRIKSEGDFEAARILVEKYAVKVDADVHQEILERFKQLNLSPYKGFINPKLVAEWHEDGTLKDVIVDYTEAYDEQMLRYSREYGFLIS